jgi:serine protease Do
LVLNERRINAKIKVPNLKYLCENQSGTLSNFGLVVDTKGNGLGVLMPPNGAATQRTFDFHDPHHPVHAEILAYQSFKELIQNPPVYKKKETSRKKWLGINMQPFTRDMANYYGAPEIKGVLLNTILKNSPAEQAGLQVGDVLTAVNNVEVAAERNNDLQVFRNLIREQKEETAVLKVFRNGKIIDIKIELGDIPIGQFLAEEVSNAALGFSVKELTKDIILAKQMDFDTEGVWVSRVERAGWSDIAGLMIGDLILKLDNNPITGLEEIRNLFAQFDEKQPEYISIFIKRGAETQFLFIKTNYEK